MSDSGQWGLLILSVSMTACASTGHSVMDPPSIRIDGDCQQSQTLERDLSAEGTYKGLDQLYLTDEGTTCRY